MPLFNSRQIYLILNQLKSIPAKERQETTLVMQVTMTIRHITQNNKPLHLYQLEIK